MPRLKIGTHIKVKRFGYTHHGIYVGEGKVIHFSGLADGLSSKAGGQIEKTTLEAFMGGYSNPEVVEHPNAIYTGQEVVCRAQSKLGQKNYNIAFNNCEHFASWCITDKKHSKQVKRVVSGAASATSALVLIMSLVVL